jgi:peptidoglycan/xylan/chitin deacetylase (PgdA/CDA1 family)
VNRLPERPVQKPIILMYHRIADLALDPWGLAVAPDRFEEQLAVLRDLREPLAMTDFIDHLDKGDLPANAVGVTFDDGYVDNLRTAKPRLELAGVPATVFIASGSVGTRRGFWWDELAGLIVSYSGDLDCEIPIAGECLHLALSAATRSEPALPRWTDWQHPRTERESVYLEVWWRLRPLQSAEREQAMSDLRTVLANGSADPEDLPMTVEEVRELAAGCLIEIGAHSVTHPVLTALPPDEMRREIAVSRSDCERLTGRAVQGFAYPHGEFDDDTRATVRDAGFGFACSTKAQFVEVDCFDRFALPRLQVMNWTAEVFERALLRMNAS